MKRLDRAVVRPLCVAAWVLLGSSLTAQVGQLVAGSFLGGASVARAGDVDDDGRDDYVVRLAQTWEVRSGATGQSFAFLVRSNVGCTFCRYVGLQGDLDADGHDDLIFANGNGLAEFVSGATGAVLFQYSGPNAYPASRKAFDHDGDGYDDVMVGDSVPSGGGAGVTNYRVLSGRNGGVVATFTLPYTAMSSGRVQWCGDVDGDGHVDLLRTTVSLANPFTVVLLGPTFQSLLASYGGTPVGPAGDTNGDGRDELLVGADLVDPVTAAIVWPMLPLFPMSEWFAADVDGDGATDVLADATQQVISGRLQNAWPGTLPGFAQALGDIDGDGREELAIAGTVYDLQGAPAASIVRSRGTPGTTSTASRPRIQHRLRPRLGDAMWVDLLGAGGPQFVFLAIGPMFDADLGPFGAPGNRAYVDPFVAPSLVADATGHARFVLMVPSVPTLLGTNLSMQWAVVDPAANPLGVVTSAALDVVVGN